MASSSRQWTPSIASNLAITGRHRAVLRAARHRRGRRDRDRDRGLRAAQVTTSSASPDIDFDGYPGGDHRAPHSRMGREGLVHLRRSTATGARPDAVPHPARHARASCFCPVSKQTLDLVWRGGGRVRRALHFAIYLTPQLSRGSMVMISDIWGHYHSRIIDDFELISVVGRAPARLIRGSRGQDRSSQLVEIEVRAQVRVRGGFLIRGRPIAPARTSPRGCGLPTRKPARSRGTGGTRRRAPRRISPRS